mmetsp:Transcript_45885/g.97475  ORF Transcript_45885/g.97475 Transcript_45885/m.97475 type:complete len:420 (+) Transcript_45885:90-1349(+)
MDQSDDVSALSMDGASAIAGKVFARRLRKDLAEMQAGIPEHEEQQQQQQAAAARGAAGPSAAEDEELERLIMANIHNGEELIEPFPLPKTFEEWQKKKERKKHKHKKHHRGEKSSRSKKSGKSGSRGSSRQKEAQQGLEGESCGDSSLKAPPIMEISIQSSGFEPASVSPHHSASQLETASDTRSYHSSMASTSSSHSPRHAVVSHGSSLNASLNGHNSSLNSCGELMGGRGAINRSLQQSSRSAPGEYRTSSILSEADSRENTYMTGHDSRENTTYMTGQSAHTAGQSTARSANSQSHITVESLQQLSVHLERSRADERQVSEIHQRLEREVSSATKKAERAEGLRLAVAAELRSAEEEMERLQRRLRNVHEENERLRTRLRDLEDRETEEGLDDVLDSMEAKIKALKLRGRRSKETK